MKKLLCGVVLLLVLGGATKLNAADNEISVAWEKALARLQKTQAEDGGWGKIRGRVGVTALVLESLTLTPEAIRKDNQDVAKMMAQAASYLVSQQKSDGSIHDAQAPKNYCTSLSVMALSKFNREKYAPVIAKAIIWIKNVQATAAKGYDPEKHLTFGGFGYGSSLRTDLSNTWIALDALKTAGVPKNDPVWAAARVFIGRCQNSTETNDRAKEAKAGNDGGSMYLPGESPAKTTVDRNGQKVFTSYGSMTYAMVLAYLWCDVKRKDKPVTLAVKWLQKNWSVKQNPNTKYNGQQGLYYYYRVMAKSLDAYGEKSFGGHHWAKELSHAIIKRQGKNGAWRNPRGRWEEGEEALVTGYSLTALGLCQKNL